MMGCFNMKTKKKQQKKKLYPKRSPLLWPTATLDELRSRRDLAVADGDMPLAFKIAYEIDKVRSGSVFKINQKELRG